MKRLFVVFMLMLSICGCSTENRELERAIEMRDKLQKSQGCSFDAVITADYGEHIYTFSMKCQTDAEGNLSFTVSEPETISGICGEIREDGGKLTFQNTILAFELMAEGQISPVSGPWVMMHMLSSGYFHSCGPSEDGIQIAIDDSYEGDAIHLEVWTNWEDYPIRGEIIWQGRRILTVDVRNFKLL